jgi:thiamine monophosphate kinase
MGEEKKYPLEISLKNVDREALDKDVQDRHDWCGIEFIGGDLNEDIYLAIFTDDYRLVFEANEDRIRLMLTEDQMNQVKNGEWSEEDNKNTLNTILRYYFWLLDDLKEEKENG